MKSPICVVKCEYRHLHPIRRSMVEYVVENQCHVAFPHQVGIACLQPSAVIYGEVLQDVRLAGCPTPDAPKTEYNTIDVKQYPDSSRILLPEVRNPARMSFKPYIPLPPEANGIDDSEELQNIVHSR